MRMSMRGWAMGLAALLLALTVAPASAHTDLTATNPRDGQTLKAAPDRVSMTFSQTLLDGGQRLVAKSPDGQKTELDATINGDTVSAAWPADLASGDYTVAYRVVAQDAHPLEGTVRFTIKAVAAPSKAPTLQPSPSAQPVAEQSGSGMNPLIPGLLVLAALVAGFFVWRARAD